MNVDHRIAVAVDQRREFVHPRPVIMVVIGIDLEPLPPRFEDDGLNLAEAFTRHQYIKIANQPPLPCCQTRS